MACALHVRATVHSFVIANKVHVAAVPGPSPNWAHPASANRAKSEASPVQVHPSDNCTEVGQTGLSGYED